MISAFCIKNGMVMEELKTGKYNDVAGISGIFGNLLMLRKLTMLWDATG